MTRVGEKSKFAIESPKGKVRQGYHTGNTVFAFVIDNLTSLTWNPS